MPCSYQILHTFPTLEVESAWREFLGCVEMPSHYCAPAFFKEPFWDNKSPFAVLARDGHKVLGAATGLLERDHLICGLRWRPQFCVNTEGSDRGAEQALLEGLLAEASSAQLVSLHSWTPLNSFADYGFHSEETGGAVTLDLTKGSDQLFREFTADKRRNIRFSIKHGVEVHQATTPEDFREFYEVYLAWRKTPRKEIEGPAIPFATFERAFALTENRLLLLARYSGKVIATNSFRFYPGGLFESSANHSRPEFVHLKPNELLQWRGIEWACRNQLRRHSLGGTHAFLRGFGQTIAPVYRYRLDRTWLGWHDLRESVTEWSDAWRKKLPKPVKQQVRRILNKF